MYKQYINKYKHVINLIPFGPSCMIDKVQAKNMSIFIGLLPAFKLWCLFRDHRVTKLIAQPFFGLWPSKFRM